MARAALSLLASLAIGVALAAGPAAARSGQEPGTPTTGFVVESTTTAPVTTTAAADETTTVTSQQTEQRAPDTSQIDEENRRFVLIVAGLVLVAVALALLTIRYWRVTKPVSGNADADADAGDATAEVAADGAAASTRSRRRPIDDLDDDALFVDVSAAEAATVAAVSPARPSRRSVAGADHADVDADWEPMSTGEQERVSGQVRRPTNRPNARDRARAFEEAEGS